MTELIGYYAKNFTHPLWVVRIRIYRLLRSFQDCDYFSIWLLVLRKILLKMLHQCNIWCTSVIGIKPSHYRGSEAFFL